MGNPVQFILALEIVHVKIEDHGPLALIVLKILLTNIFLGVHMVVIEIVVVF